MRDWFSNAFGDAIADARAKLIDEGWFGRRVPEHQGRSDLGWSVGDHPREPLDPSNDIERGIDR